MRRNNKPHVLCVDDEPGILEGVELHLRRKFRVRTATSGAEGLEILREDPSIAIVMSDMRMPQMNGAQFLTAVREAAPDATRMLLTGQTDIESAIAAVNEGQIFRFLTKPCPPDQLLATFASAMEQHRLITAERELLEKTVYGSVKALISVLGLTHPLAFGRASRLGQYVGEMCQQLEVTPQWTVEIAAMVSQLGSISLSEETAERVYYGRDLSAREQALVARGPETAQELLGNIPRLEPVIELVMALATPQDELDEHLRRPVGIIQVALDFDVLVARGANPVAALGTLRDRDDDYDQQLVEALAERRGEDFAQEIKEIAIRHVNEGMVFTEDVRTESGSLLVARGFCVTAGFRERAKEFRRGYVVEPVRVMIPRPGAEQGDQAA